MILLSGQIKELSTISHSLSEKFDKNRRTINKLNETSKTLQRLQIICQLPSILEVKKQSKK